MNEDEHSGSKDLVTAIAACGLVLLVALIAPLWWGLAERWLAPWLPMAPPVEEGRTSVPKAPAAAWTDQEIKAALMQCIQALAPVAADAAPLDPIRDGDCGAPAPVLLKSLGSVDKVLFDPPLTLDCAMVVALDRWLRDSVQPAAREAFSSSVSKIIGSSYVCRNVYNRPDGHLSQHAFANAIDVPTFVLADGRKVDLTHGWGPTQRDLIAAAKAKKTAPASTGSVAQQKANTKKAAPPTTGSVAEQKDNTKDETTEAVKVSTAAASVAASPSTASADNSGVSAEAKFLRLTHEGGCKIFSTVLGPEANDPHRTHLHLDLQGRQTSVCK